MLLFGTFRELKPNFCPKQRSKSLGELQKSRWTIKIVIFLLELWMLCSSLTSTFKLTLTLHVSTWAAVIFAPSVLTAIVEEALDPPKSSSRSSGFAPPPKNPLKKPCFGGSCISTPSWKWSFKWEEEGNWNLEEFPKRFVQSLRVLFVHGELLNLQLMQMKQRWQKYLVLVLAKVPGFGL